MLSLCQIGAVLTFEGHRFLQVSLCSTLQISDETLLSLYIVNNFIILKIIHTLQLLLCICETEEPLT